MTPRRPLVIGALLLLVAGTGLYAWSSGDGPVEDPSLPLAETSYVLGDDLGTYDDATRSGGPPKDGIPSIDDPQFLRADAAPLAPGDVVIGFVHDGDARAYPQKILVQHEIVNDRVGGLNVAVTYCPLTATAQVFERGGTTFGTSGSLLNSNLVMYDRETDSWCSQIAATCYRGQHRGRSLVEHDAAWTTWERWRAAHPDTRVLSEDTGHLRNYDRDPYGSYNPRGGYYARDHAVFPLLHESDAHHAKEMVVGGRTTDRSAYFVLEQLARDRVQTTEHFLAVYDPDLDTGHLYRVDGEAPGVSPAGEGRYEVDGEEYAADALPLEPVVPVEAFFFAWHAFYPDSETPSS
jgi:hypothetical protein